MASGVGPLVVLGGPWPCFRGEDGETEAQRAAGTCQGHRVRGEQRAESRRRRWGPWPPGLTQESSSPWSGQSGGVSGHITWAVAGAGGAWLEWHVQREPSP